MEHHYFGRLSYVRMYRGKDEVKQISEKIERDLASGKKIRISEHAPEQGKLESIYEYFC